MLNNFSPKPLQNKLAGKRLRFPAPDFPLVFSPERYVHIDQTGFIERLLGLQQRGSKLWYLKCPPGFGKTFKVTMMETYLRISCQKSCPEAFTSYEISNFPECERLHMWKYDVIRLDFAGVTDECLELAYANAAFEVLRATEMASREATPLKEAPTILKSFFQGWSSASEHSRVAMQCEAELLASQLKSSRTLRLGRQVSRSLDSDSVCAEALTSLIQILKRGGKRRVALLIDNADMPFLCLKAEEARCFYETFLLSVPACDFALLTGVHDIPYLNWTVLVSMDECPNYFGFGRGDMIRALRDVYAHVEDDVKTLTSHYGVRVHPHTILNPYSCSEAIRNGLCDVYTVPQEVYLRPLACHRAEILRFVQDWNKVGAQPLSPTARHLLTNLNLISLTRNGSARVPNVEADAVLRLICRTWQSEQHTGECTTLECLAISAGDCPSLDTKGQENSSRPSSTPDNQPTALKEKDRPCSPPATLYPATPENDLPSDRANAARQVDAADSGFTENAIPAAACYQTLTPKSPLERALHSGHTAFILSALKAEIKSAGRITQFDQAVALTKRLFAVNSVSAQWIKFNKQQYAACLPPVKEGAGNTSVHACTVFNPGQFPKASVRQVIATASVLLGRSGIDVIHIVLCLDLDPHVKVQAVKGGIMEKMKLEKVY